jgi:cyclopropane-fatty-acyl-phospholipid synthase
MWLLLKLFRQIVTQGSITIIAPDGARMRIRGTQPGPDVAIRVHDESTAWRIGLNPRLQLGEAYMDGRLTVVDGDVATLLDFCTRNTEAMNGHWQMDAISHLRRLVKRISQHNPIARAQRNVAHHYDLSDRLYALFLDADRQYSCAYFASSADTLEMAQQRKKRHIAAKLLLEPGQRILDIGCGWGGLALELARYGAAEVVGVTLSVEQHRVAAARAAAAGVADRVKFKLQDYREETQRYDRIVSVGMFEHVGIGHYREYVEKIRDLMTDDGVALVHSIGRSDGPGATNPWIAKYIFPGGYSPALSEVIPVIERAGLWVTDVEILRLHYADTLRAWRRRFEASRDEIRALYDDRFCRMWEFYLAGAEMAFRNEGHMVFQIQLARRVDAVPLTRDYITEFERGHGKVDIDAS